MTMDCVTFQISIEQTILFTYRVTLFAANTKLWNSPTNVLFLLPGSNIKRK